MELGAQIGSHRVEAKLGEGGMADVYKVWNTGLHRHEALKAPKVHFAHDPTFVNRFLTEARTVASLQHPHIATIHTVSHPDEAQPFFTMELVEGGDLADLLRQRGHLSLDEALPVLKQIASALDYAHARGVIHRDVKPANVLLQGDGHGGWNVKVVDFGIARAQEEAGGARLTKTGMIVGTPEYMSPEQGGSGAPLDRRTDVYSLGVVAYEMLCGHPPFSAGSDGSAITVIMSHIRDMPRAPLELVLGLPLAANNAILKALAKDPADRFENCASFVNALAGSVPVEIPAASIPHTSQGNPDYSIRTKPVFRLAPVLLGLVAILGVALVLVALSRTQGTSSEPDLKTVQPPAVLPELPEATQKVKVPDLVGMNEKQARDMLSAKSLDVDVTTGQSTAVPSGRVISQKPAADALTDPTKVIQVRISTGPPAQAVSVPAVSPSPRTYAPPRPVYTPPVVNNEEERASIEQTIAGWKSAWERLDISGYMSYYSSDARIRSNKRWYSYSQYYSDEATKFSQGGTVHLTLGSPAISVSGDTATARFSNTFQRFGGKGDYRSIGMEMFKLRKDGGRWLVYEDVFRK